MFCVLSAVRGPGQMALARLPEGAAFTATFTDDHTRRDVTGSCADLLLAGLAGPDVSPDAAADGMVPFAFLHYTEPAGSPAATFTVIDASTGLARDIEPDRAMELMVAGMVLLVKDAIDGQDLPPATD